MLDKSTADCLTVYLRLGRMAQVRVQRVALLQAFLDLLVRGSATEGRTSRKQRGRCRAKALVPREAQRAVRVAEFVGDASCRLRVVSSLVAGAARQGRFLAGAGLQSAVARLNGSIILRRVGRREERPDAPALQEADHGRRDEPRAVIRLQHQRRAMLLE